MNLAVIILNFNDAYETISQVKRIHDYEIVSSILVVDNASTDSSLKILRENLRTGFPKVFLIRNKKNGGYGYGNNRGIKYAFKNLGSDLILIANPDSFFDEELLRKMENIFKEDPLAACTGAVMSSKSSDFTYRELKLSGWMYRSALKEILYSGPLLKRIFSSILDFPLNYYDSFDRKVPVYAVSGSLLMLDAKKFLKAGGYDEAIFLYEEEGVLGNKLLNAGFKTYLIKKSFHHLGGHSIERTFLTQFTRQKLRQQSELIYLKKYLGAGKFTIFIFKILQSLVLLETYIWTKLMSLMSWKK